MKNSDSLSLINHFWASPADALLSRACVAAAMNHSVSYFEQLAHHGGGPVMQKIGRRVLYRKSSVLDWLEKNSCVVANTSEQVA